MTAARPAPRPESVDQITTWLWRGICFEIGFLLLAAPFYVDEFCRTWWPVVGRLVRGTP